VSPIPNAGADLPADLDAVDAVLVHDWLTGMRGGEKVLEALAELFPRAPIYTLVHRLGSVSAALEAHPVRVSWLGRLPGATNYYRKLLPLYPSAMAAMRLPPADLVLSSSTAAAKAVRKPAGALHICYCNTPMRYLWDLYDDYFGPGRAGLATRAGMHLLKGRLRRWDVATASGVDHWIANSANVQERIQRLYGREAVVLHPFVDLDCFRPEAPAGERQQPVGGRRFLVVSALVPYKRIELAIAATARLGRGLDVVGLGPERPRLERAAAESGADVRFLGWLPDAELAQIYRQSAACLMPGEEDFGIAPLEAMATGRPVVAWARGGALETVIDGETGLFFAEPDAEALAAAMARAGEIAWDPARLRARAAEFSRARFLARARELVGGWLVSAGRSVDMARGLR
jgi:glycosyltransferase involved in cell wall biosynthesis